MATTEKQRRNLEAAKIRSSSEAREKGRRGGIKSGQRRREIKNTKAFFNIVKDMPVNDELNALMNEFFQTEDAQYTYAALNLFNLLRAANDGNVAAMKLIAEIDGSNEPEKQTFQVAPDVYIVSSSNAAAAFQRAEQKGIEDMDDDI